jgi:very-short-patch-repair endonuclease
MGDPVKELLRGQSGVIGREQCLVLGLSESQIRNRLRSGTWIRVASATFADPERWGSPEALCWRAILWAGESAVLCGAAAAFWWGMEVPSPAVVRVMVPVTFRRSPPPGVTLLRRALDVRDRDARHGLRLTARPLTALMTAVELGGAGSRFLDRALQTGLQLAQLEAAHRRNPGRHGAKPAGRLLAAAGDGAASSAERLFLTLLRSAGLRGWEVNAPLDLGGVRVVPDVLFRAARVVVEIDGWAFHSSAASFQRDRARQNTLHLWGFRVLRFTWEDITERPDLVVAQLRAAGCGS